MNAVALDLHAPAPPVSPLTPCEVLVDVRLGEGKAGRYAVDHRGQGLAVGLARGEKAEDFTHTTPRG